MKVKQLPDDFQVQECTERKPTGQGPFALYRLEKTGWSTPDALAAIRRRWGLDLRRVSCGGLKDRHACTVQYLSILHGPRRNLTHHSIRLHYLGQVASPYTSKDIRANHFRLTLRAVRPEELAVVRQAIDEICREGVPNYFDDQRFGSVGRSGEFIARYLVQGRFEAALRLALTGAYEFDRTEQKREKSLLAAHWGDWPTLKRQLSRGHARSLVDYLVHHPQDFRGAVLRLRPELQGLYLSAYQSALWNRLLARWLAQHLEPQQLLTVRLRSGAVPMHRGLTAEQLDRLARLTLPLPSARLQLPPEDPRLPLLEAVLAEEGLRREQLKIKGMRRPYFSRGERPALCLPAGLTWETAADELHPGRQKLVLGFELPRGCYATLLVKRITALLPGSQRRSQSKQPLSETPLPG